MKDASQAVKAMIIVLFAVSFVLLGWFAPAVYAANVPQDRLMEVHSFTAADTSVEADRHRICFDRTVHKSSEGTVLMELVLIDNDGTPVEMESRKIPNYFQEGHVSVETFIPLPDNLREGTYHYFISIDLVMADARVERTISYTSQEFYIGQGVSNSTFTCG